MLSYVVRLSLSNYRLNKFITYVSRLYGLRLLKQGSSNHFLKSFRTKNWLSFLSFLSFLQALQTFGANATVKYNRRYKRGTLGRMGQLLREEQKRMPQKFGPRFIRGRLTKKFVSLKGAQKLDLKSANIARTLINSKNFRFTMLTVGLGANNVEYGFFERHLLSTFYKGFVHMIFLLPLITRCVWLGLVVLIKQLFIFNHSLKRFIVQSGKCLQ